MPNFLGRAIGKIDGIGRRYGLSAARHQMRSIAPQMLQSDNIAMRAAGHYVRGVGNISNSTYIGVSAAGTAAGIMGARAGARNHPNHPVMGGIGGYIGHSTLFGLGAAGAVSAFSRFRL